MRIIYEERFGTRSNPANRIGYVHDSLLVG
jgi:hypothetical protein